MICLDYCIHSFNGAHFFQTCSKSDAKSLLADCSFEGHWATCQYDKIDLSPDERYLAGITNCSGKMHIWRTNCAGTPVLMCDEAVTGLSDISWCTEDEFKVR